MTLKHQRWGMGAVLALATFALAAARAGESTEKVVPPDPGPQNVWVGDVEPGSFYLVMNKSKNELTAHSFANPSVVHRLYRAISGTNSGDKVREGDKKTPEGIYFVEERVEPARLKPLHGAAAFALNYPNAVDRIYKRTGHGIWIHGVDNDSRLEKRFDTLGCVAVGNHDILDLATHLKLKNTPIVIIDQEQADKPLGVEADGGPLHARVEEWAKVWSSKDVDAYLKFYSPDFYARHMNYNQWADYKRRLAKTYKYIDVKVSNLKVLQHGKYSVAIFSQEYTSNMKHWMTEKRLYWVGTGPTAQILAEEVAQERALAAPGDKEEQLSVSKTVSSSPHL